MLSFWVWCFGFVIWFGIVWFGIVRLMCSVWSFWFCYFSLVLLVSGNWAPEAGGTRAAMGRYGFSKKLCKNPSR